MVREDFPHLDLRLAHGNAAPATAQMTVVKAFDPALHAEFDLAALERFKTWMISMGGQVVVHPLGHLSVDTEVRNLPTWNGYAELEVRPLWKKGKFPFKEIHIPYRKGRYALLGARSYFVSFRSDLMVAMVTPAENLRGSQLKAIPNKFIHADEQFFCVPISLSTLHEVPALD